LRDPDFDTEFRQITAERVAMSRLKKKLKSQAEARADQEAESVSTPAGNQPVELPPTLSSQPAGLPPHPANQTADLQPPPICPRLKKKEGNFKRQKWRN
jgi:hypothetical protein